MCLVISISLSPVSEEFSGSPSLRYKIFLWTNGPYRHDRLMHHLHPPLLFSRDRILTLLSRPALRHNSHARFGGTLSSQFAPTSYRSNGQSRLRQFPTSLQSQPHPLKLKSKLDDTRLAHIYSPSQRPFSHTLPRRSMTSNGKFLYSYARPGPSQKAPI